MTQINCIHDLFRPRCYSVIDEGYDFGFKKSKYSLINSENIMFL